MESVYVLADNDILHRLGGKLKATRLRQNITQQNLAENTGLTLSTIKRIENGEIGSFSSLIRVLRILGLLEIIQPLTEEDQPSPQEFYEMMNRAHKKKRQRASIKK